jgi:mono/diheme cytochrome c family protein
VRRTFIYTVLIAIACIGLVSCAGQRTGANASNARHSDDVRAGERTFRGSCAACHGADARGTGPIAELLTVPVPDLTRIQARRNGEFPELEIFRIIDGQSDLAAHGPRHMPVWGYEFFGDDVDDEAAHRQATQKVEHLVAFLRSIQR